MRSIFVWGLNAGDYLKLTEEVASDDAIYFDSVIGCFGNSYFE